MSQKGKAVSETVMVGKQMTFKQLKELFFAYLSPLKYHLFCSVDIHKSTGIAFMRQVQLKVQTDAYTEFSAD